MATPYSDSQLAFILSMLSNYAPTANSTEPTQAAQQIEQAFTQMLPGLINVSPLPVQVTTVWGPYVVVEPRDIKNGIATATNTMVVFKYQDPATQKNVYTVGIAGTKSHSLFDKWPEDVSRDPIQPWTYGQPSHLSPQLSQGTLTGLVLLLGLNGSNGIVNFFSNLNDPGATITVGGHSLGGALAPALALVLFGASNPSSVAQQAQKQNWTTRVYATAGPDTGNQDYVSYFNETFPPQHSPTPVYNQFNTKIWNSLDIVPQVWSQGFVNYIDNIYGKNEKTPVKVQGILEIFYQTLRLKNNNTNPYAPFDPSKNGQFQGTFNNSLPVNGPLIEYDCKTNPKCTSDVNFCQFLGQALYQHLNAYYIEFGLSDYLTNMDAYLRSIKAESLISVCESVQELSHIKVENSSSV